MMLIRILVTIGIVCIFILGIQYRVLIVFI
jgi:hypothetical protein